MGAEEVIAAVHRQLEQVHEAIVQGIEEAAKERVRTTVRQLQWDAYRQQLDEWLTDQKKRVDVDVRLRYPLLVGRPDGAQVH